MRFCGCGANTVYGYPGDSRTCCSKCKSFGMINLIAKRCEAIGCSIQAGFGYKKYRPINCKKHALSDMKNVVASLCLECPRHARYNYPGVKNVFYCGKHVKEGMISVYNQRQNTNMRAKRRKEEKEEKEEKEKRWFTNLQLNPDGTVASWGKAI